jgi:hypothetical protein
MQHSQKVNRVFLEPSGYAAKMFHSIDQAFDNVALPIDSLAEWVSDPSIALWRDHRRGTGCTYILAKLIPRVSPICNHIPSSRTGQQ